MLQARSIGVGLLLTSALSLVGVGCDDPTESPASAAYLEDGAHRRAVLETALWAPELPYSKSLLNNYGHQSWGWDLLPEMVAATRPFTTADADALASGQGLSRGELTPIGVDALPGSEGAWRALGERVFFDLPMRYDGYITYLASRPHRWGDYGITPNDDGSVRGVVVYEDSRGDVRAGISCAFCHSGDGVPGRGARQLDLGTARGEYMVYAGQDPSRYLGWGAGRVDVTDDPVDSPTAIPDLVGLADAQFLNHSGVIALPEGDAEATATMATRFETQYILGHRMRTRPPRVLTWALARYVRGLTPRRVAAAEPVDAAQRDAGRALFEARCASCHDPDRSYSGGLVDATTLGVDLNVATTPERGTGFYKVPSLLGVAGNAPYLHDGTMPTLSDLIASGHPHPGATPSLAPQERAALVAFLRTL